jgi:hypothetical protein
MGKRELIIVLGFVVAGVVVYQLTAPPLKEGERGFSLSRIFSGIRKEMTANSASATIAKTGTLPVRPGVTEVRLSAARSVPLTIIGERRQDIGYEMSVESTGPDEATAREYAGRATITDDDLGEAQKLSIHFPQEGQQTAQLTLRVPSGLLIRLENAGRVRISDVRAVSLRNLAGGTTISNVSGAVSGSHRSGELTVTSVGSVDLALSASRARFSEISGAIQLTARSGECTISKSSGAVEVEMMNGVECTITEHAGPVRVSGETGSLRVALPSKDLMVDVRRMRVEVTLAAAIPLTVITTDEPLKLTLAGPPGITIDAAATDGGTIRASDFALEPTRQDRESRLGAPVGGGGPRVVLRNIRADIVIGLRK